jgi:hypothetical protein
MKTFKARRMEDASGNAMRGVTTGINEVLNGLEKTVRALNVAAKEGAIDSKLANDTKNRLSKMQSEVTSISMKVL